MCRVIFTGNSVCLQSVFVTINFPSYATLCTNPFLKCTHLYVHCLFVSFCCKYERFTNNALKVLPAAHAIDAKLHKLCF